MTVRFTSSRDTSGGLRDRQRRRSAAACERQRAAVPAGGATARRVKNGPNGTSARSAPLTPLEARRQCVKVHACTLTLGAQRHAHSGVAGAGAGRPRGRSAGLLHFPLFFSLFWPSRPPSLCCFYIAASSPSACELLYAGGASGARRRAPLSPNTLGLSSLLLTIACEPARQHTAS